VNNAFAASTLDFRSIELRYVLPSFIFARSIDEFTQYWAENYWKLTTLDSLCLTFQLGHGGGPCLLPGRSKSLTVLHTNGFHRVNIAFCGCSSDEACLLERNQLLRLRLFPASPANPKTVFTFSLLDLFCHLSTQGKLTTYDLYLSLLHLCDNIGVNGWHVSESTH
jgi:hypothetical protein